MEYSLASFTFKGSISQAIAEAKTQRKLFVVYISGKLIFDLVSFEIYMLLKLVDLFKGVHCIVIIIIIFSEESCLMSFQFC